MYEDYVCVTCRKKKYPWEQLNESELYDSGTQTDPVVNEHTGPQRKAHRSNEVSVFEQSEENMPVLQQVLGILDLVLCSCDGDDAVLRAL